MRYGLTLPQIGPYADARKLAELAGEAEKAGWDGFFIWDHVAMAWPEDLEDTTVALTAIALATERVRFGAMVTPLPRRRPWKVAREMSALDRLSGGRLIFGAGLGIYEQEFAAMGEEPDMRARASALDEGLELLAKLWTGQPVDHHGQHYRIETTGFTPTPVQERIPVWVGASWPGRKPFERAARWDGVCVIARKFELGLRLTPEDISAVSALCLSLRRPGEPFDVVAAGATPAERADGAMVVAPYIAVGATWWFEDLSPWAYGWSWQGPWPLAEMRRRIQAGPPREA